MRFGFGLLGIFLSVPASAEYGDHEQICFLKAMTMSFCGTLADLSGPKGSVVKGEMIIFHALVRLVGGP
jgi:hypothetical protein